MQPVSGPNGYPFTPSPELFRSSVESTLYSIHLLFLSDGMPHLLCLSTHQGQKQNMVRHHVLHYLATSKEDTPREECNFKLEKKKMIKNHGRERNSSKQML